MDVMCCFFFQAEDGIRDGALVTGVQTCALPISWADQRPAHEAPREPAGPQQSGGVRRRDYLQRSAREEPAQPAGKYSRRRTFAGRSAGPGQIARRRGWSSRSEAHTSELQPLTRISSTGVCLTITNESHDIASTSPPTTPIL